MGSTLLKDRREAGRLLADRLARFKERKNATVLAIPRGGVVVGYEIAKQLGLKLDVVIIKKIGYPGNEEFAVGAASMDDYYLNEEVVNGVSPDYILEQVRVKQDEARLRYELLRGTGSRQSVKDMFAIVVDDGVATGATMKMAIRIIQKQSPKGTIVAIPVAPPAAVAELREVADEVVCLMQPREFFAIGQFYRDFSQVSDEEAMRLLREANR